MFHIITDSYKYDGGDEDVPDKELIQRSRYVSVIPSYLWSNGVDDVGGDGPRRASITAPSQTPFAHFKKTAHNNNV